MIPGYTATINNRNILFISEDLRSNEILLQKMNSVYSKGIKKSCFKIVSEKNQLTFNYIGTQEIDTSEKVINMIAFVSSKDEISSASKITTSESLKKLWDKSTNTALIQAKLIAHWIESIEHHATLNINSDIEENELLALLL